MRMMNLKKMFLQLYVVSFKFLLYVIQQLHSLITEYFTIYSVLLSYLLAGTAVTAGLK